MELQYDIVIVIPVGPACVLANITDTIQSIGYYVKCNYKIVVADDSQNGIGRKLLEQFPDIDVLVNTENLGKVAGLYMNLAAAYRYALNHYDFPLVLKLDDDALIIGHNAIEAAQRLFSRNQNIGMAGRYIKGQLSEDCYGNIHDNYWPRKQLLKDTCSWKIIRRPVGNYALRKLFLKSLNNGYELGENIQGGSYFISCHCLRQLYKNKLLPSSQLRSVNFGEDLLFSLLVKAVGMQLGDLGDAYGPIGCAWKGLPASPDVLQQTGKKIIHSVRFWEGMIEEDIRKYYRELRLGNVNVDKYEAA